jgi:MSHA biogenesis protein MshP
MFLKHSGAKHRQRGSMMITAIFIMTVMLMLGFALNEVLSSSSRSLSYEVVGARAFHAANSGVEVGLHHLFPPAGGGSGCAHSFFSSNPSLPSTIANQTAFSGCRVLVTCQSFNVSETGFTHYRVTSSATCQQGSITTERSVAVEARER